MITSLSTRARVFSRGVLVVLFVASILGVVMTVLSIFASAVFSIGVLLGARWQEALAWSLSALILAVLIRLGLAAWRKLPI